MTKRWHPAAWEPIVRKSSQRLVQSPELRQPLSPLPPRRAGPRGADASPATSPQTRHPQDGLTQAGVGLSR